MRLHLTKGRLASLLGLIATTLLLCGCDTLFSSKPTPKLTDGDASGTTIPLKSGDRIRIDIVVTGGAMTPIPYREEQVKEDGTINLQLLDPLKVVGKSCRDVEKEITGLYITNNIYKNLTVTVTPLDRYFYVGGQVMRPGEQHYNGPMTVTKAIQAAGDFTDYANKKKIDLFRTKGDRVEKITVNYWKLLDHPDQDPPVYPGDKIEVHRRWA